MAKVARALTALAVQKLKGEGYHAVGTVPGLHLQITKSGARSWIYRTSIGNRRPEFGLGSFPAVTLQRAWELAREYREMVKAGVDPAKAKATAKAETAAAQARTRTFRQRADEYVAAKQHEWGNVKHGQPHRSDPLIAQYRPPRPGFGGGGCGPRDGTPGKRRRGDP